MKTGLLLILLLIITMGLSAQTIDEQIDLLLSSGDVYLIRGDFYYIPNLVNLEDFPKEDVAIGYLAETAYVFAVIQDELEEYTQTDDTDIYKEVKYVACPYADRYGGHMAFARLYYVKEQMGKCNFANTTLEERLKICHETVKSLHGIAETDIFWNTEE